MWLSGDAVTVHQRQCVHSIRDRALKPPCRETAPAGINQHHTGDCSPSTIDGAGHRLTAWMGMRTAQYLPTTGPCPALCCDLLTWIERKSRAP